MVNYTPRAAKMLGIIFETKGFSLICMGATSANLSMIIGWFIVETPLIAA